CFITFFLFSCYGHHRPLHSFPTRRSSDLDSPELLGTDAELAIRIDHDRDARTIRVIDNGIGMSREEAITNLGTIARSGTREFFGDRKSTRLNSSHVKISYAVFCLKKKKQA